MKESPGPYLLTLNMTCAPLFFSRILDAVAFVAVSYPAISTMPGQAQSDPLAGVVP